MNDNEDEDIDELPIFASLSNINKCDCCDRHKLKRTVKIDSEQISPIYLGVICCSKRFGISMTGNPNVAIKRLQNKLKEISNQEILGLLEDIT